MGKYKNLGEYLKNVGADSFKLSFTKIEEILRFPLPSSAKKYRAWWANDRTHVQAMDGWLTSGWDVESVHFEDKMVVFRRRSRKIKPVTYSFNSFFFATAREIMSKYFEEDLSLKKFNQIPKTFEFVSKNLKIVGDGKFLSLPPNGRFPIPYLRSISESVWFLEKIEAEKKFIVFGNSREIPKFWLNTYGHLLKDIDFYFLHMPEKRLEKMTKNDDS
jgi:hypothetical protein